MLSCVALWLVLMGELTSGWQRLQATSDCSPTFAVLREETCKEASIQTWSVAFIDGDVLECGDETANRVENFILHLSRKDLGKLRSKKLGRDDQNMGPERTVCNIP